MMDGDLPGVTSGLRRLLGDNTTTAAEDGMVVAGVNSTASKQAVQANLSSSSSSRGIVRASSANSTSSSGKELSMARGDLLSAGSTWSGLYMLKLGGNQFSSSIPEVYYRTVGGGVGKSVGCGWGEGLGWVWSFCSEHSTANAMGVHTPAPVFSYVCMVSP
jgi:hypothetical protein